jgi:hypothetical protein
VHVYRAASSKRKFRNSTIACVSSFDMPDSDFRIILVPCCFVAALSKVRQEMGAFPVVSAIIALSML